MDSRLGREYIVVVELIQTIYHQADKVRIFVAEIDPFL